MARYRMDSSSPKDSGAMLPMDSAYITPESPAYIELTRKTRPLYRWTLTPMTDAATSLSRRVCSARPGAAAQQVPREHVGGQREDQPEVPEPLGLPERHADDEQVAGPCCRR